MIQIENASFEVNSARNVREMLSLASAAEPGVVAIAACSICGSEWHTANSCPYNK